MIKFNPFSSSAFLLADERKTLEELQMRGTPPGQGGLFGERLPPLDP